tara:strand:+ start:207 stop:350 length:144 start_codon:yes stop_codon:yes gene_type:complete
MAKILEKIVCENGDCSNKKIKILPLISLITVNLIIATSFGLFCYHNL